ncbi:MAG: hypothetical protein VKJ04_02320 [Vampirovibrionales bacterium]|nr:hypothetical protein [Vampirovibrionales bacterium]
MAKASDKTASENSDNKAAGGGKLSNEAHLSNDVYQPCERRFRNSNYFLQDQLRCSEAVEDFRSVRNLINKLSDFKHDLAFQFQSVTVPRD